jgi:Collagen triple helix repeat (20 copies)
MAPAFRGVTQTRGPEMNALEVRTVVEALTLPLQQVITRATAPLLARIEALEARAPIEGPPGPPGRDGEDGKSVDIGEIGKLLERAVAALPAPEQGARGEPGLPGKDGLDADPEQVKRLVTEAVAALPPAQPGQDGAPGRDGRDGVPGSAGRDGIDGKDGAPGAPGRDGLSAEDMNATTPDDGRTIVITLARGGEVISQNVITTGLPIDRGVWKDGAYAKGDVVSLGGEIWIARRDTKLRPIYGPNSDWRLAVKKGRDGKDGHDGKPGEPGPEGKPGRDLTQLGTDGTKW